MPRIRHENLSLAACWIALLACLVCVDATLLLNCDTGWLSYAGRAMTQGKKIYTDLAETNPPLIIYIHYLTSILSHTAANDFLFYKIFISVLIIISFWLSDRLLVDSGKYNSPSLTLLRMGLLCSLVLIATNFMVFGEREHIFIITFGAVVD